jgi:hypothetical protein
MLCITSILSACPATFVPTTLTYHDGDTIRMVNPPNKVPAIPTPVSMAQPDGDTLTVKIKGDERIHWYETMDGYTLLFNKEGYLTYAQLDEDENLQPSEFIATDIEKRSETVESFLNTIEKRLSYSNEQIKLKRHTREIKKFKEANENEN